MIWRLAKSLLKLREQVNELYPHRDKASDGSIGDLAHSQRKSDHNPNAHGVVTAIDIDKDLRANDPFAMSHLVLELQNSGDKRIKYIIWNGQITLPNDITRWKKYTGINQHKHHCHISVSANPDLYDNDSAWSIA